MGVYIEVSGCVEGPPRAPEISSAGVTDALHHAQLVRGGQRWKLTPSYLYLIHGAICPGLARPAASLKTLHDSYSACTSRVYGSAPHTSWSLALLDSIAEASMFVLLALDK